MTASGDRLIVLDTLSSDIISLRVHAFHNFSFFGRNSVLSEIVVPRLVLDMMIIAIKIPVNPIAERAANSRGVASFNKFPVTVSRFVSVLALFPTAKREVYEKQPP